MTIRLRITLFVVLSFLSILCIGGFALYQSDSNAKHVRQLTDGVIPSVLASSDLISQVKQVQLLAMEIITEKNPQLIDQANDKLQAERTKLDQALTFQSERANSQAQRGLVEQAQESVENYFSSIDTVTKQKIAGKDDVAEALFFGNVVQYQVELSQIVDTLRIEKDREKSSSILALNGALDNATKTILMTTVAAMILLMIFGVVLYRRMVIPIGKMQKRMSEIAASQDFSQSMPVEHMDEVGHSIVAFNGMIEKIQEASAQIKQKTADMQTMLQNIPQGLLTIMRDNTVHPEYSVYLEEIFETTDISGKNVIDLVFANAELSDDVVSQLEAVTGACIGEDRMNFDFNSHLMVGEIKKHMPDGRVKILDISWSPITDENDTIIRLMLCIKDVTELRELALKAGEQKVELEIIGEILGVNAQKFNAFITDAARLIDENMQTIQQNPEMNAFAIAKLFRNMHTIKGNARTYGLLHLAGDAHHAEQYYDDLRHQKDNVVWEQMKLLEQLGDVSNALAHYRHINEKTLGRINQGAGSGDQYLMIERKQIQRGLRLLQTVNTSNIHELLLAYNTVRKTLRLLGTESLPSMLQGVLDSLPSLAKELGKEVPEVQIDDNGFVMNNRYSGMLKNVFMHVIRNAMDHGLETANERQQQQKSAQGTITVEAGVLGKEFHIAVSDDGRGIALKRIRSIAVEKGLIEENAQLNDIEIANLVMKPGFSTKEEVTEISGRGVGMDAVSDFVARENGKMSFMLTDGQEGDAYRHFKVVLTFPANIAVEVDGADEELPESFQKVELTLPTADSNAA